MLKHNLRFALACAASLVAIPAAHAQSAPASRDEISHNYPGPETEWRVLGRKDPNQYMLIRAVPPGKDKRPRVEVLFVYTPADDGYERIDNYYTADCDAKQLLDESGTVWAGTSFLGISPSETHDTFEDVDPDSVHEGIVRYACGEAEKSGALRPRDAAIDYVIAWSKRK